MNAVDVQSEQDWQIFVLHESQYGVVSDYSDDPQYHYYREAGKRVCEYAMREPERGNVIASITLFVFCVCITFFLLLDAFSGRVNPLSLSFMVPLLVTLGGMFRTSWLYHRSLSRHRILTDIAALTRLSQRRSGLVGEMNMQYLMGKAYHHGRLLELVKER
jgi:hypothetical protein